MKTKLSAFLSGVLITLLINSLIISAVAITNRMTISVDPINIKVNGEIFVPKDANGKEVPVFAYNGTTYAPLRALAEAYGLTVGYDPTLNLATVDDPEKISAEENNTDISDAELETAEVERYHKVQLLKVGEQYYSFAPKDIPQYFSYYKIGNLIFGDDGGDFPAWYLEWVISLILTEEFIVEPSDNPYFPYVKDRIMKTGYEDIKIFGNYPHKDETIWYSPSKSYTPKWIEINGYKLYNLNPYTAETDGLFQVQDGIRYYDGNPCINDVMMKAFGIDIEIIFGEYEGFTYMEIKNP